MGAAAFAPTSVWSPKPPDLCPHHTPTTYSGFHATVQASRYALDVPVFHAKREVSTSATCPSAACARSAPESMSEMR